MTSLEVELDSCWLVDGLEIKGAAPTCREWNGNRATMPKKMLIITGTKSVFEQKHIIYYSICTSKPEWSQLNKIQSVHNNLLQLNNSYLKIACDQLFRVCFHVLKLIIKIQIIKIRMLITIVCSLTK